MGLAKHSADDGTCNVVLPMPVQPPHSTSQAPIEEAFAQTCRKFHKLKTWSADILGPSHAEVHNIITSSLRLMAHRLKRNPEASQYPAKHEHGTSSPRRSGCFLQWETESRTIRPHHAEDAL